jgi:hypothetical protein
MSQALEIQGEFEEEDEEHEQPQQYEDITTKEPQQINKILDMADF